MADVYRIYGSELSPYSVKVRSYFRYKGIPHEWIVRSRDNMAEFQAHARLPLIPLVLGPEGTARQDSTPILEHFESLHPDPSIHPSEPTLAFLSALIEEYGDEWGNKPMFHYRWTYETDQQSAAQRLARENAPGATPEEIEAICRMLCARMVPRLRFVGSSDATRGQIERSYERQLELLEAHLRTRPYLFGSRPAFADFGLAPQLYECATDPTPGALLARRAPRVQQWIQRMLDPKAEGGWESWGALEPTLLPLLEQEVAGIFLPWSDANARALDAGEASFSVEIEGAPFEQQTQKYHARSLAALRSRYAAVAANPSLRSILDRSGCLERLL